MTTEKFEQKENRISPNELVRLAPKLKPYLRRPDPTWQELIDAADWLRNELGVSKSLWGEALHRHGPGTGRGRASRSVEQQHYTFSFRVFFRKAIGNLGQRLGRRNAD
jgi:hypothetical protein